MNKGSSDLRVAHLRDLVAQEVTRGSLAPGQLLPPVRELTATWRCSPNTVVKTLTLLLQKGVLERPAGSRRFYVSPAPDMRASAGSVNRSQPAERTKSARVAARIMRDCIDNAASPMLPSKKELLRRYHCHHRTLLRALDLLEKQGYLVEESGGYRVPGIAETEKDTNRRIALVTSDNIMLPQFTPFFLSLEHALSKRRMPPADYYVQDPRAAEPLLDLDRTRGFVYIPHHMQRVWAFFFRKHAAIPLAIVDLSEAEPPYFSPAYYKSFLRITPDNYRAGLEVAKELWSLGHRHVAVFSPTLGTENWADRRLRGIASVFKAAGCSMALHTSASEALKKTKALHDAMVDVGKWQHKMNVSPAVPEFIIRYNTRPFYQALGYWALGDYFHPMMIEALANRKITAWICLNDDVAYLAHHFLTKNGVSIGKDISLVGFDNSVFAASMGLSSYDFQPYEMGQVAVQFVLAPYLFQPDEGGAMRTFGTFARRRSVGPARRR